MPTPSRLKSHPPERRRRTVVTAPMGSCCCCCCLHTVGGLIGGILGSFPTPPVSKPVRHFDPGSHFQPQPPPTVSDQIMVRGTDGVMRPMENLATNSPAEMPLAPRVTEPDEDYIVVPADVRYESERSTVRMFWVLSVIGFVLTLIYTMANTSSNPGDGIVVGLVILALVAPFVQLGVAVVVAVLVAIVPRSMIGDKPSAFLRLFRIAGFLFAGGCIGMAVMWVVGVALLR